MATLAQDIAALNASARKIHGSDICIMVARAVAFGNDDNLILVQGKKHAKVAVDVARSIGKKAIITEEISRGWMGVPDTKYSAVTF